MKQLKVVLIGAGNRGTAYTDDMAKISDRFKVVAVAEPIDSRREYIKEKHNIPDNMCFKDWKPLLNLGKIADVAIIATMDRGHFAPAMEAISLKYDVLLEKPASPTPEECMALADSAEKNGVKVLVCHVLRYTPFFNKLKEILDSKKIGDVISINHEECVGDRHQTHSFVRGNWGNSERSSCMLLQKSCHDMDILQWLLGKKCKKIHSFGALTYFTKKNAPDCSPDYCIEGCPVSEKCPYDAVKLYMDETADEALKEWFRTTCTREANPTLEMVEKSLRTTQYGKCVFKCDNDVVDHQTVNILFEDDITVTFTMCAFNKGGRFMHIMGTKGEIHAAVDGESPIEIFNFETRQTETVDVHAKDGIVAGHGGGDIGIINAFYDYICGEHISNSISTIRESCDNHMIVFAAEESRKNGQTVDFEEYISRFC